MSDAPEHAGRLRSFWKRTAESFATTPLSSNASADVVVIGAGIAGMMIAHTKSGGTQSDRARRRPGMKRNDLSHHSTSGQYAG
jgi:hypothetical protein